MDVVGIDLEVFDVMCCVVFFVVFYFNFVLYNLIICIIFYQRCKVFIEIVVWYGV